jgi:hypothetical protein
MDEHEVIERLREVLSRPGARAYLLAQPRSAAVEFLLWAAERLSEAEPAQDLASDQQPPSEC